MKLIISIFITNIYFITSLTSNETWNMIMEHFSEGKLINNSKSYFIFEENNFTQLDINGKEIRELNKEQEQIYQVFGLRNYIIAINNISGGDLIIFRNEMRDYMKAWGIDVNNSIFTIAVIDEIDARIYTGSKTRSNYISDNNAQTMKTHLLNHLKNKEYYYAWVNIISDIEIFCLMKSASYFNNYTTKQGNTSNSGGFHYSSSSHSNIGELLGPLLGSIGAVLFGIGITICCCKCKCCKETFCTPSNNMNTSRNDYDYNRNDNNSYGNYSVGNHSYGNNSVGNHSYGNNSVGGHSFGNNNASVGGHSAANNSGCSGGA